MVIRSLLIVAAIAASAPAADAPTPVGIADPAVVYQGRWDSGQAGEARASWPATSVKLRFRGTAASATLRALETDWVQVVVDGAPTKAIELTKADAAYALAEGLPAGEHVVEIVKRTEAWSYVVFRGFVLPAGGKPLPPAARAQRRLEVYGDSITCGYGDEAASKDDHFSPATANAWLAYGPVAARAVGAECSLIAVSGIKLWPDNALPPRFADVLRPWDNAAKSDPAAWVPQAVVVNLGTNDFGGGTPEERGWCEAMRGFIAAIRGRAPGCHVYLATGSMMGGPPLATLQGWLDAIAAEAERAGDRRIHRLDFDPQQPADGFGADWHPNTRTHARMAEKLAAALKRDLGW